MSKSTEKQDTTILIEASALRIGDAIVTFSGAKRCVKHLDFSEKGSVVVTLLGKGADVKDDVYTIASSHEVNVVENRSST